LKSLKSENIKQNYNLNQNELIVGCIRRDPVCQKTVFDLYAGRMLGVSLRYARNKYDAEDILQEAFIKVLDKIDEFRNEGSFEGWIRKIVLNTALKKYTSFRYTVEKFNQDVSEFEELGSNDVSAYSHLTEKDLLKLIHELPDGYRLVFNLFVIEGYKHEEIANMLNINPGTSRSQLSKARTMLQKQILQLQRVAV
jgi:RNA polymerase sigma-70 factor (ECF subfamily)